MPLELDIQTSSEVDSLRSSIEEVVVDSLSGVGYEDFSLSEAAQIEQQSLSMNEIYRDTVVEAVFGDGAMLAEGVRVMGDSATMDVDMLSCESAAEGWLSLDLVTNAGMLIVVFAYLLCMYLYYYDVMALIHSSWQRNAPTNRDNERRRSDIFYGFLGKLFLLGVGFVGVFASVWVIRHGSMVSPISEEYMALTPLVGMGLFIALIVVQYIVLLLVGFITRSISFVVSLMRMRLVYFVFATIAVAPLLLVAALSGQDVIWQILTYLVATVVLILYLRESIELFISKKISILHWILYLCTVEILPLTLLWQIALRLR